MCLSFVRIHVWKRSNATSRESSRMWWWDVRARPCVALGPTPLTAAVSPLTGATPVTTATTLFALVPHPPRQVSEDVIPGYVCRRVFVCACACSWWREVCCFAQWSLDDVPQNIEAKKLILFERVYFTLPWLHFTLPFVSLCVCVYVSVCIGVSFLCFSVYVSVCRSICWAVCLFVCLSQTHLLVLRCTAYKLFSFLLYPIAINKTIIVIIVNIGYRIYHHNHHHWSERKESSSDVCSLVAQVFPTRIEIDSTSHNTWYNYIAGG